MLNVNLAEIDLEGICPDRDRLILLLARMQAVANAQAYLDANLASTHIWLGYYSFCIYHFFV